MTHSPSRPFDAAVVGAGPAGACAAFELARQGARVVLLDKEDLPRYKTCGGGVVRRAQNLLAIDLSPVAECEITSATMTLLRSGLSFQATRSQGLITMTMRAAFDQFLVAQAEAAGATIRPKTKVIALARAASGVRLQTTDGPVAARFVIASDGVHSAVAKAAGWPDHRRLAPALEAELYVSDHDLQRFSSAARFDFDIPPHGYGWIFPKRDHLSVGVLTTAIRDRRLNQHFDDYVRTLRLARIVKEERHGFLIPLAVRSARLAHDRILLVGDAAGLADPVTAEGISHAIQSGQMAARALMAADFDRGKGEAFYQQTIHQSLLPELRAARLLAALLYSSPWIRTWLFRRCGGRLTEIMADVMAGRRTYQGTLCRWGNYLKLFRSAAACPRIG
jgi:geranylgeranyl reductase family protein